MKILKSLVVLLLLAVFGCAAVAWWLPARIGYQLAGPRLPSLELEGLGGTIWDGTAAQARLFGHELGRLRWHLHKQPLLDGRLRAEIGLDGAGFEAEGTVERRPGLIEARNLGFQAPAAALGSGEPGAPKLGGTLVGKVDEASFGQDGIIRARGRVEWHAPSSSLWPGLELPGLLADFAPTPQGKLAGTISDDGSGELAVSGGFSLRIGVLDAEVVLRARDGSPLPDELMPGLGEPQPDGSRRIVLHQAWQIAP